MPYVKKTIPDLANIIKQQISSELGLDVALIDDASLITILSKVIAATETEQYADLEYFTRQALPNLADEEGIREWGSVKGVAWRTSTVSSGVVDLTGVDASFVASGTELTTSGGVLYITTADATIAGGVASVSVESQEGGEDKNLDAGIILTFVSTPSGLDNATTVDGDGLTGGADIWTPEQYKQAVLASFKAPARGGAAYDYEFWTRQVANVSYVWAFGYSTHPSDIVAGAVEVYFLMEDTTLYPDGIPTLAIRNAVVAYIDTVRPLGMGSFLCPELSPVVTTYQISITPNTSDTQAAVTGSLEEVHASTAPGGTITTGQMNRAISDSTGVTDFKLTGVNGLAAADVVGANINDLLTVGTITFATLP